MGATALSLVNRLRRRHRFDDVSGIAAADALSVALLDCVNESVRDIVSERRWPWNVRTDGILVTSPSRTGSDLSVINGASAFSIAAWAGTEAEVTGDRVARLLATADGSFGQTSFRVTLASLTGAQLLGTLETTWPGTTAAGTGAYRMVVAEYLLPDTVMRVESVKHQETPMRLTEVPPHAMFDDIVPRPHDVISDSPDFVAVGGYVSPTSDGTTVNPRLRLIVWPVPSSALVLHYSYYLRPTEMTAATDRIDVPDEVVDVILDHAYARSNMSAVGNDAGLGRAGMVEALSSAMRKHSASAPDPNRARALSAHDRSVQPGGYGINRYRGITGL